MNWKKKCGLNLDLNQDLPINRRSSLHSWRPFSRRAWTHTHIPRGAAPPLVERRTLDVPEENRTQIPPNSVRTLYPLSYLVRWITGWIILDSFLCMESLHLQKRRNTKDRGTYVPCRLCHDLALRSMRIKVHSNWQKAREPKKLILYPFN